jgi:hypothetical protein
MVTSGGRSSGAAASLPSTAKKPGKKTAVTISKGRATWTLNIPEVTASLALPTEQSSERTKPATLPLPPRAVLVPGRHPATRSRVRHRRVIKRSSRGRDAAAHSATHGRAVLVAGGHAAA